MVQQQIEKLVRAAIKKEFGDFGVPEIVVERPVEKTYGDYSTNIALQIAKELKKNPLEIAKKVAGGIGQHSLFEKIEAASPGLINFYLSRDFFKDTVKEVLKHPKIFGRNNILKDKKVIVEYTDPNPFKVFHIGHLSNNSTGESISRIIEFQGGNVKRANYQGDVGLHVAKAIWGVMDIRKHRNSSFDFDSLKDFSAGYAYGSQAYESDGDIKKEIIEINRKIYDKSDKGINKLYEEGRKVSLKEFEKIYKKLGTKFDYYFFESKIATFGKRVVEDGLKKGIFEKGERGATIFKGEKLGLHTRVFINSEGLATYEAKELGLAKIKYDKFKYDVSIIVTGNEIIEYFKVVLGAMTEMFPELAKKTKHIWHGMLRLPEGKMSSRTGNVVTFEFLFEEVKKIVSGKIEARKFTEREKNEIAEKVAIGAIKYSILKQSIGSDIIYNIEKSISFEGDSGPYLQYSLVRALSVLEKAKVEKIKPLFKDLPDKITDLEKMLCRFPEIAAKAGQEYEPHLITTYLTELAREFNNYYANNKIVEKNDEFSPYKIAITKAFSIIMKNGLWLLGIPAPEKM